MSDVAAMVCVITLLKSIDTGTVGSSGSTVLYQSKKGFGTVSSILKKTLNADKP